MGKIKALEHVQGKTGTRFKRAAHKENRPELGRLFAYLNKK